MKERHEETGGFGGSPTVGSNGGGRGGGRGGGAAGGDRRRPDRAAAQQHGREGRAAHRRPSHPTTYRRGVSNRIDGRWWRAGERRPHLTGQVGSGQCVVGMP